MFKVGSIVAAASLADALSLGHKPQLNDCEAPQFIGQKCVDIHKKSGNDGKTATVDDLIEAFHTFGDNAVQVAFAADCAANGFLDGVVTGNFDTESNIIHGVMGDYCDSKSCGALWVELEVSKGYPYLDPGCQGKSEDGSTCSVKFSLEEGVWPWQTDSCSILDKIRHVM